MNQPQHSELLNTAMTYDPVQALDALIAPLRPVKRMVRVTMDIAIEDIDWSSCTCEAYTNPTDRGEDVGHDYDISLATYEGNFVEFDDHDSAADFYIEEVWGNE